MISGEMNARLSVREIVTVFTLSAVANSPRLAYVPERSISSIAFAFPRRVKIGIFSGLSGSPLAFCWMKLTFSFGARRSLLGVGEGPFSVPSSSRRYYTPSSRLA